jgi:quercetin dioxygenase-like cupin family protein
MVSPKKNSRSSRVTITRVTVETGASQAPHAHSTSEQVWIALAASGTLRLADGATCWMSAGNVVWFADGDLHPVENAEPEPFVYMAVTERPIDFSDAHCEAK